MIGDCGLAMQDINEMICPEIGYHIRRDCQKKGYAKEAVGAVRDRAFSHTPFHVLYSYMKNENLPSAATAMSIGMHFAGEYPDAANGITAVYAIEKRMVVWPERKPIIL